MRPGLQFFEVLKDLGDHFACRSKLLGVEGRFSEVGHHFLDEAADVFFSVDIFDEHFLVDVESLEVFAALQKIIDVQVVQLLDFSAYALDQFEAIEDRLDHFAVASTVRPETFEPELSGALIHELDHLRDLSEHQTLDYLGHPRITLAKALDSNKSRRV